MTRKILPAFFDNPYSGTGKQRLIAEEVLRYGKVKVAAEVFTFRELASATDNFNSDLLVGEGGFGRVYRGQLKTTKQVLFLLSHFLPFFLES